MADMVTYDALLDARASLAGVIRETPLLDCPPLAAKVGGPAFLKCENLQRAGSFKVRGAYVRLARLTQAERARGVVAASAGNHAQGVALAAGELGIPVVVFMPEGASLPKVTATRAYGAVVRSAGSTVDKTLLAAKEFAEETGAVFIHPFDHPDVIAGQGTVALELLEQCPDVRTVLAPTGGGGLLAGVAVALQGAGHRARVVGVQAEGAAAFPASLKVGHPLALATMSTIADGIAVGCPGEITFRHIQETAAEVVTVSEQDIARAALFCAERSKMVVEPAGAVGVAAVLAEPARFEPPVAVILSGGNVDPLLLLRIIQHGLGAAGRYLRFTVRTADRPGSLAAVLNLLAAEGVNVVDIEHFRQDSRLQFDEVVVSLSVETKGAEHSERLMAILRRAGYSVQAA